MKTGENERGLSSATTTVSQQLQKRNENEIELQRDRVSNIPTRSVRLELPIPSLNLSFHPLTVVQNLFLLRNVWKTFVECFPVGKSAKNAFPVLVLPEKKVKLSYTILIFEIFKMLHLSYIHSQVLFSMLRTCTLKWKSS